MRRVKLLSVLNPLNRAFTFHVLATLDIKWRLFNLKRKTQLKRRNIEALELVVK